MTYGPLTQLVRDRLAELDSSAEEAADRSGGAITKTSIIRLKNGAYRGKRINADTVTALALALDVPARVVAEAAAAEASLPAPEAARRPLPQLHCGGYVRHRDQEYGRGRIVRIVTDQQLGSTGRVFSLETFHIAWDGLRDHGGRGLHAREELVPER